MMGHDSLAVSAEQPSVHTHLPAPPFVVFGASKSGTTWLQRCLDAHPEVRCHFQRVIFPLDLAGLAHPAVAVFDAKRSPFGGVFQSEEEERRYQAMLEMTSELPLLQRSYLLTALDSLEATYILASRRRLARAVVEELLMDEAGFKVYGTKAYTDLEVLFSVFPEANLIHIVRDGRDVCVSKRFHMLRAGVRYLGDERWKLLQWLDKATLSRRVIRRLQRSGYVGEDLYVSPPDDGSPLFNAHVLTKFAADWASIVRYIRRHARAHPGQAITVTYERMLGEPEVALAEVFRFLDVAADEDTLAKIREVTNIKRLQKRATGNASFFRKGRAGTWREYFRRSDAELFQRVAGDVLIEVGYEPSAGWVETV